MILYFDPTKVVQNTELSLPGGAIKGWDRRNIYYFQMINSIASHYKFNIDTPFKELSNNIQDIILTINLALNNEYNELADLNNDGIINVLDIVQLVNIILN